MQQADPTWLSVKMFPIRHASDRCTNRTRQANCHRRLSAASKAVAAIDFVQGVKHDSNGPCPQRHIGQHWMEWMPKPHSVEEILYGLSPCYHQRTIDYGLDRIAYLI